MASNPGGQFKALGGAALLGALLSFGCGSDEASSVAHGTGASPGTGGNTSNDGGGAGGAPSGGGTTSTGGVAGGAGVGGNAGTSSGGTSSGGTSSGGTGGSAPQRWGAGWSMDSLANTALQNSHDSVNMRFRAKFTGLITSVRAFYMGPDKPGYGQGSPSGVELSIQDDDGSNEHMPSGTKLGVTTDVDKARMLVTQVDRLYTFSPGIAVQAGKFYHLVGKNLSADTAKDFFSFDFFHISPPLRQFDGRYHPLISNDDWAHGYRTNSTGTWVLRPGYSPILQVDYDSGQHQGCGYMELGYTGLAPAQVNGTQKRVRQKFAVASGTKTAVGAGVRLSKANGSSAGLVVTLRDSSGTALDSFSLASSSFPDGAASGEDDPDWGYGTFSKPVSLTQGQTYTLELSTASGSTFYLRTIRKNYGQYDDATFFSEGNAELTVNGGAKWEGLHGWGSATDSDLQFFFELAP